MHAVTLASVVIECLPYQDFIKKYDTAQTLFYLDPPYYNCENHYGKGLFRRDDFNCIADILLGIKGRFIISINDTPEIREIYKDFNIKEISTLYSISSKKNKPVNELIISN